MRRKLKATRPTVLLVEDDQALSSAVQEALEAAGFVVVPVADGVDAWRSLQERTARPDVILLDLMMPNMDGFAFRKRQLADVELCRIPVVVSSCVGETVVGKMSGVAAILRKPYAIDRLVKTLREVCGLDR